MHNKQLADARNIPQGNRDAIDVLHTRLKTFLHRSEMWVDDKEAPEIVRAYEFVLQDLWQFPLDDKFHSYTFDLKRCTCPKIDNMERVGRTSTRIYSGDCPHHGGRVHD